MRARTVLLPLLLLPALALAQGAPGERLAPTGRYLVEALPERVDLVVHTPDLPALLRSAPADGLGSADAWKQAFRAQMEAWGARTGAPELLVEGAESMLAAADGEVVLASMRLPPIGGPARVTLLAFRTRRKRAALEEALGKLIEGGLVVRYPGAPAQEQIAGRPITVLAGVRDRLFVRLQDGMVAVADHPLALGLLFRGLETAKEPQPAGEMLLEVRHGRGEKAWTGWTYGARESVSWSAEGSGALSAPLPPGLEPLVAVALAGTSDAPVLPVAAPDWFDDVELAAASTRLVAFTRGGGAALCGRTVDGASAPGLPEGLQGIAYQQEDLWAVADDVQAIDPIAWSAREPTLIPGGAARLGWLRGWANGRLPIPVPGIDRAHLLGPLTTATEASGSDEPFLPWKAPDRPGELRGPRWHGPTTMLALRTIADIAAKRGPGERDPATSAAEELPVKEGAALPPPKDPRAGDDDAK